MTLTIATRQSPLALWQAEHVRDALQAAHPGLQVELLKMTTEGDRRLGAPLAEAGGKGLFIKELEHALLDGRAQLAVHSMKDVPAELPRGFEIAAILQRADVRDALVAGDVSSIDEIPDGAHVGTASLRRQAQLVARRPGLRVSPVRGNVGTRLSHLDAGKYDALLLAAAGLDRLDMGERISQRLPVTTMLPAIGQGAVGVEIAAGDSQTRELLAVLHHGPTATCLAAERAVSLALGGDCTLPLAAHAVLSSDNLHLEAFLGLPDGSQQLRWQGEVSGGVSIDAAAQLGQQAAAGLRAQGADAVLQSLRQAAH